MRVFALSDIHADYQENMAWIENLSSRDYLNDALILAGDVTHVWHKLEKALAILRERFRTMFYVPGNHELWCQDNEYTDSLAKFQSILELCESLDIATQARYLEGSAGTWLVPLFSWYSKPEQGEDSLFVAKAGEDPRLSAWSDNYFVLWPGTEIMAHPANYFLGLNQEALSCNYDAPVISFSHFLPRTDLIFSRPEERIGNRPKDRHPSFNFSRVAGTSKLDEQIRQLNSVIHVYGHQHRNRYRLIDGILYVSACRGYAVERNSGAIHYIDQLPRLIWDTETAHGNPDIASNHI